MLWERRVLRISLIAFFRHTAIQVNQKDFDPRQPVRNAQAGLDRYLFADYKGNISVIKSLSQSFKRSLIFNSECKRLMTWSIDPGHRMLTSAMKFRLASERLNIYKNDILMERLP